MILGRNLFFLIILITFIILFQNILTPKYMSNTYEGAMIAEYYSERFPHDVIFIGDCEVYSNYSPIALWEEYGITSYIRGGPQQLIWQSYYILEDTLKHEAPEAVVFNVLAMQHSEPASEGYNRLNLDGLPLSLTKLKAVNASKMDSESIYSYIFPIMRWHSRWNDISPDDLTYLFGRKRVSHNGYMLRCDIKPVDALPSKRPLADYSFNDVCWEYLNKITTLCKANDISLLLVKSPAVYPYWYDEWDIQIRAYAEDNGLLFLNLNALSDEIGIDMSTDTFNAGIHLNVSGAEKNSSYLGKVLSDYYGLSGHKDEPALHAVWEEKTMNYNAMKAKQEAEFNEHGKVLTFVY